MNAKCKVFNFLFFRLAIYCQQTQATCTRKNFTNVGCDACGVGIGLGNINITSAYLQPVSLPLGSDVFRVNQAANFNRVGGFYDLGSLNGNVNYYAT